MSMDAQNGGGNLGNQSMNQRLIRVNTEDPASPGTPDLKGGEI